MYGTIFTLEATFSLSLKHMKVKRPYDDKLRHAASDFGA